MPSRGHGATISVTHALVRHVSRSLSACELLHLPRQEINFGRAQGQHDEYVRALESAGVRVRMLPEEPTLPDSTFVEDTVVVLDELAIICQLGTPSREPEAALMAQEIKSVRPILIFRIESPGSLEGGDVLRVGKTLFIGISSRTNLAGIDQARRVVERHGYSVIPVAVQGCLHLKTAVTAPAAGMLLANPAWVDVSLFDDFEVVTVPVDEPWGANTLAVNGRVLVAHSAPQTAEQLRARGLDVEAIDVSELQKAEAGLTCLSVLFSNPSGAGAGVLR
jgi:dimethylargininase